MGERESHSDQSTPENARTASLLGVELVVAKFQFEPDFLAVLLEFY